MLIQTENFKIVLPADSDYANLQKLYNDSAVMLYIPTGLQYWDEKLIREKIYKHQKNDIGIHVIKSIKNEFIGEASIFDFNEIHGIYEIGFIIHRNYWGQGLGTFVCKSLISYCFNELNSKQVIARMFRNNLASKRVCIKSGMTQLTQTLEDKELDRFTFSIAK